MLFRSITVFTLLRRYAETLYNGDTPLRWNLTRAATPLRWNVCSTPLRRYAETLSAPIRRYAETLYYAKTPIRRNLVLRRYAETSYYADTPKLAETPIRRNLVLRWYAETGPIPRYTEVLFLLHLVSNLSSIWSIFICWQLLWFLVSAWHAYPHLRALSHEHCCKFSCAFFPFTGIWQWYFHIFWNIHPCCCTHTCMNIYISLSLSIYLISIYLSIPCTSCRCKWISR